MRPVPVTAPWCVRPGCRATARSMPGRTPSCGCEPYNCLSSTGGKHAALAMAVIAHPGLGTATRHGCERFAISVRRDRFYAANLVGEPSPRRLCWPLQTGSPPGIAVHPSRQCPVADVPRRGMSGCSRRSPLDSCSWTPRGGSGSGPLARRGTATLVMANCTSRLAKVPRSRPLSRDRTRCPRCPASRGTTRCRHRQAVAARVPRRARPVVRIRPQVRPGALHRRARCRPARQDAAGS